VTAGVDDALDGVDVLAGPTTPMVAPAWDSGNYLEDSTLDEAVRTTGPFNLTGHPAVSVPCGSEDGLPVGLQFIGRRGGDADAPACSCRLGSDGRVAFGRRRSDPRGKAIADFGPPTDLSTDSARRVALPERRNNLFGEQLNPRWIGEVDELQHDFVDTELRVRL